MAASSPVRARRAAVGRASPEARTDAELPRARPIAIAPPLTAVAGEVSNSLLLLSHRIDYRLQRPTREDDALEP